MDCNYAKTYKAIDFILTVFSSILSMNDTNYYIYTYFVQHINSLMSPTEKKRLLAASGHNEALAAAFYTRLSKGIENISENRFVLLDIRFRLLRKIHGLMEYITCSINPHNSPYFITSMTCNLLLFAISFNW